MTTDSPSAQLVAYEFGVSAKGFSLGPLSFALEAGSITGLVGPNGAGKTTLMSGLVGLRRSTGSLDVSNSGSQEVHSEVSFVPEEPALYEHLTVGEHLRFVELAGRTRDGARTDELLERLDLGPHRDKTVSRLSLGMKRKTALAMGMLRRSAVLMLDEPLNGLDPVGQRELRTLMLELRAEGAALLVSSHWLPELERVADTYLILEGGQLVGAGTISALRRCAHVADSASLEDIYFELLGRTVNQ